MSSLGNALTEKLSGAKISEEEFERRLTAADQGIASVAVDFTDWAGADIATAQGELEKLVKGTGDKKTLAEIFRLVHDIKGQGGTFGYALATKIAGSLCDFIRVTTAVPTPEQITVLTAYLAALQLVLSKDIKGDGDPASQELFDKLAVAASRVSPLS